MVLVQAQPAVHTRSQEFITKVYGLMAGGLALTGAVAYTTVQSPEVLQAVKSIFYPLLLGELALVWILSASVHKLPAWAAALMFVFYAALNGLTFSILLLIYTEESIARTFFITAGTFGAMSLYGLTTRQNLTSVGSLGMMGLIGVIIASVVNIFIGSSAMGWAISFIGVIVFIGLTAYDAQKLMKMADSVDPGSERGKKAAVMGALTLYLDFINLFLMLLRVFDRR